MLNFGNVSQPLCQNKNAFHMPKTKKSPPVSSFETAGSTWDSTHTTHTETPYIAESKRPLVMISP